MPARALLLMVVVGVAIIAGVAGTVYVLEGNTQPTTPSHPVVSVSSPEATANGFSFRVQSASAARAASNYRVNLGVNDTIGFALPLAPFMPFTVAGTTYTLTWTDADGGGQLTANDSFELTVAGGPSPQTTYTVFLLWRDGSELESVAWTA